MSALADYVRRLLDENREEVARADTKASIILASAGVVAGILLTGLVAGAIHLSDERWYVGFLAWLSGAGFTIGVGLVGFAVFPRVGKPELGHARWFSEIAQFEGDEAGLAAAVDVDRQDDPGRDLHQVLVLAGIVRRKYQLTKWGMWCLAVGFAAAG
jgi:Family of unknown function (DUF5706)